VTSTDVVAAFRFADACARAVAQFFTEYDCLLTPTTACVSRPVEQVYPKVIENREAGPRVNTEQERSGEVLHGPAAIRWRSPTSATVRATA
jgi:Asp-tRNA(Asn)/Glu-tRNA(Gln) amidotransferase A subunit family amidase